MIEKIENNGKFFKDTPKTKFAKDFNLFIKALSIITVFPVTLKLSLELYTIYDAECNNDFTKFKWIVNHYYFPSKYQLLDDIDEVNEIMPNSKRWHEFPWKIVQLSYYYDHKIENR